MYKAILCVIPRMIYMGERIMRTKPVWIVCCIIVSLSLAHGQTADAYEKKDDEKGAGLLDPSRFSMRHAAAFGMSSGSGSNGLQSQSLYMTMLQYQFSKPVTLNLNFGLPIHSTYNDAQNLTRDNIESAEYLKNMPFSASMTWQPSDNFTMRLTVARDTYSTSYLTSPALRFGHVGMFSNEW